MALLEGAKSIALAGLVGGCRSVGGRDRSQDRLALPRAIGYCTYLWHHQPGFWPERSACSFDGRSARGLSARGADAYNRLLGIVTWLGVITLIGGLLWIFAGAGIYGSPLGGISFDQPGADWGFWIMLVVVFGPLALLHRTVRKALATRGRHRLGSGGRAHGRGRYPRQLRGVGILGRRPDRDWLH